MNEENLIKYYNKFNEDKRLNTKHGNIEYITSIYYLHKYLKKDDKIIDIGAGTGKYSKALQDEGYDVTAVELVKHNLKVIEEKGVKAILGNAIDLKKIPNNTYDITILFGPMYHLIDDKDKLKALNEAKRITKKGGFIFVSYCLNEYAIITHAFIEGYLDSEIDKIDKDYKINPDPTDLYSFVRLEDIDKLNKKANLKRIKIISQDGPSEYLKKVINKMDDQTYQTYLDYHLKTCERKELIGAGRHALDILQK